MPWIPPSNRPGSPRAPRYYSGTLAQTAVTANVSAAAEAVLTTRRDLYIPPEFPLSVRADPRHGLASGTSVLADISPRDEFGVAVHGDGVLIAESAASSQSDSPAWMTFLGTLPAGYIQVEWLQRQLSDIAASVPNEILSPATADAQLPAEWTSSAKILAADSLVRIESLESAISDIAVLLDDLSGVRVDMPAAVSDDAGLLLDVILYDELLSAAIANQTPFLEGLASPQSDQSARAETTSRLLRDVLAAAENLSTGTMGILSDAVLALDWLRGQLVDSGIPAETAASSATDLSVVTEWLPRVLRDVYTQAEVSLNVTQTSDSRLGLEWAALARSDVSIPLEQVAALLSDIRTFSEILSAVAADRATAFEIIKTQVADVGLPADALGHAIAVADAILRFEAGAAVSADTSARFESLISVHRADVLLVIEALLAVAGDLFTPLMESQALTITADSTPQLEAMRGIMSDFAMTNEEWERIVAFIDVISLDPIEHMQESSAALLSVGRILKSINRLRVMPQN